MTYETILYEKDDRIATITLNRPEKLSTIKPQMPCHPACGDEAYRQSGL